MGKLLVLAFLCSALCSCIDVIDSWEITQMTEACKDHGGIDVIETRVGFYPDGFCNDGTPFNVIRKGE